MSKEKSPEECIYSKIPFHLVLRVLVSESTPLGKVYSNTAADLKKLNTLGGLSDTFYKADNFVTSCLLFCRPSTFRERGLL